MSRSVFSKAKQRNINLAVARAARFTAHDEFRVLLDGLKKRHRELPVFHFPVGNRCSGDLVDRDFFRERDADFARRALRDFDVDLSDDRGGVFAEASQFRERAAQPQNLRRAMVFCFSFPRETERLVATRVGQPFALGAGLRFFRKEAAGQLDLHALPRKAHGGARNTGARGRQRDALFAGGRDDGQRDIELQNCAAGVREKRGKLVGAFPSDAWDQGDQLTIEFGFANEKARRNWHAHPAVFQYVDGKTGAAGGKIAVDAQVVIDARERGINGRAFRFALGRIGFCVQRSIVADGDDHPAGRVRCSLRGSTTRAKQERYKKKTKKAPVVAIFVQEENGRT